MKTADGPTIGSLNLHFPIGQFLLLFLPVAVVILATGFAFVQLRENAQLETISAAERTHLQHLSGFMAAEISGALNHLASLSTQEAVLDAIDNPTRSAREELQSVFLTLARRNPAYLRIVWIDESGSERVRIDRQGERLVEAASGESVEQGDRHAFEAVKILLMGEIYLSPLDLQAERGRFEMPPRPMMRIGTPLQTVGGRRHGVMMIHVDISHMLDVIRSAGAADRESEYLLLNRQGQWLGGSLYLSGKVVSDRPVNLAEAEPLLWNRISERQRGSAELADGFWIWDTVLPVDVIRRIAQVWPGGASAAPHLHSDEISLKLVARRSIASLIEMRRDARMPVILGAILILVAYGWSLLFYLRSQLVEKRAEIGVAHAMARAANLERLRELEERFRLLFEASSVGLLVVDPDGAIQMCNPAAATMFGYSARELEELSVESLLPESVRMQHARLRSSYLADPQVRRMGVGRELEAVTADGRHIPVEVGLNPFLDHGRQLVLATIIDLTERKGAIPVDAPVSSH